MERVSPEPNSGCWLWTAFVKDTGYGITGHKGKQVRAHRLSLELHGINIPKGMDVLHKCDVRSCVNPDHLVVGTHKENMADMKAKGRDAYLFGERSKKSKLTSQQVAEIREARSVLGIGCKRLSRQYGVSSAAIQKILNGQTWSRAQ